MLDNYIIWNGISSEEFDGLLIKKIPALDRPRRKRDVYSVPGRNGDVIFEQDAFEDYELEYQLFLYSEESGTENAERITEIAEWLLSPSGYTKFQDSYDPDYVRYAYIVDDISITNALQQYGTVKITFRFRPERFLEVGLFPVKYLSAFEISNPTRFASKPLLVLEADENVTLKNASITINGDTILISELEDTMYIDFETQDAYYGSTNLNPFITLSGGTFPKLQPGPNEITWSNRVKSVTITPRWWTI